jgi:arylsulfatase A-like enzyme
MKSIRQELYLNCRSLIWIALKTSVSAVDIRWLTRRLTRLQTFQTLSLLFSLYCCFSLAFASPCELSPEESSDDGTLNDRQLPNVVMIISDDQAWTDYGFMGHPVIQTPNLDALAQQSAFFPRAYVPTALCRPSLATMITGLYAHQHGLTGNDPSASLASPDSPEYAQLRERLISFIDGHSTLPRWLSPLGFLSHQSGKWWEGPYQRGGFTHGMTRGFPRPGGRHGDAGLTIGREGLDPIVDFLEMASGNNQPFFVWYAPFMPHTPHTPPDRLLDKYRSTVPSLHVARYYAMCEWFDETVGQLVSRLEEMNLASNTLFIYVGDNGWIQSEESPGFAPRSKQSAYEKGVRQPTLIRWDGVVTPGQYDDLVSSIDLVPTILSAVGLEVPDHLPGENLLPLIRDGQPLERDAIFGEGFSHDIADLDRPETSLLYRWVIQGQWKLLLTYDGIMGRHAEVHQSFPKGAQLFDLLNDPHEDNNLAPKHPELVDRLSRRIAQWWPVTDRKMTGEADSD